MSLARTVGIGVLLMTVVVAGVGAAFLTGVLGTPSAGLEDRGDWGSVSEERTEVVTTVWVNNPNPVGLTVGDSVEVSYQLSLNDVRLASGEKSGIDIPPGNGTVQLSTDIRNRNIPPWWVAFVRDNETIPLEVDTATRVSGPVSATADFPTHEDTLLAGETPIITALSEVASGTEGTYTETLSPDRVSERTGVALTSLRSGGYVTDPDSELRAGYEVRDGRAAWGPVSEETTTVYFHFRIHNPGDVPVPAAPSNLGVDVEMNDVELFAAEGNDTSLRNPGDFTDSDVFGERVLEPGETEDAVYAVEMQNENVDDWFGSHVRQGEHTELRTEGKFVFSLHDIEFELPGESPVAYTCDLQTNILVDDQNTGTNCGRVESLELVDETDAPSDEEDDTDREPGTENGSRDEPSEPGTENGSLGEPRPPTAVAEASPDAGRAPLDVQFDASGATDPNGDILRYVWRFDDGHGDRRQQSGIGTAAQHRNSHCARVPLFSPTFTRAKLSYSRPKDCVFRDDERRRWRLSNHPPEISDF
ncbi:LEA type 2 family protein [Halorientalis pallida]|uniref:Water stress and hypersensitive response domain-containing protein n=1 Tax=Halorientalis pallida TaxID=2479928 RepID=A0A498KU12_9EURY|nr:LEA type 2 family protein [Halorientalis pallida]RXK48452.1 hypothetical protein EAF64_12285 [Halorientalis pallida]